MFLDRILTKDVRRRMMARLKRWTRWPRLGNVDFGGLLHAATSTMMSLFTVLLRLRGQLWEEAGQTGLAHPTSRSGVYFEGVDPELAPGFVIGEY